ncbi:MAG: diguanylate phosphodiesterase, partial [Eubacterium sp.]
MEENSQFKGRKRSIIKKLFVPMIIVMVVQALLFFMVILWGGTIEELNNNALDILNERVINRKNYLENEMIQRWSNMDESVKSIGSNVQAIANAQGTNLQELENKEALKNTILINNADNLIYLLRKNGVSGVFIILTEKSTAMTEVGESDVKKPALYIRDSDPSTDTEDRSDLSIERAPVEVVKALDLSMSTSWDTQLTLKKDDAGTSDFYYKPLKASFDYPDLDYHDLGYWSYPFRLNENENDDLNKGQAARKRFIKNNGYYKLPL